MATFTLRRFSCPETLKAIAARKLLTFLKPHRRFLRSRGMTLPQSATDGDPDYEELARVFMTPDTTLKIHYTMVKGTGDVAEEVVVGDPSAERYDDDRAADRERYDRYADDRPADRPHVRHGGERGRQEESREGTGSLRLSVKPDDASVYVDGRFYGTARQSSRLVLSPGRHRIEVVRPGYHTYDNEVEVGADAPADVDVTLER